VHGIDFFFDYLALSRVFHGKPMLASTHGGYFHTSFASRFKQLYFHSVTRLSAMAYQRVVCTSENDARLFAQVVSPSHLRVIENGVDVRKFYDASSRALLPRLLYFGRWSVNKGLLESLDLISALVSQFPEVPWHLTIAGREYDIDVSALMNQIHLRGITPHVTLDANPSNQALRNHMAKSSYFICQSHHEGFGIAPIEAMSAGLFPLLSDIPPFRRLVESSGVGLLLNAAHVQANAQQIYQTYRRHVLQDSTSGSQEKGLKTTPRRASRAASLPYAWAGVAQQYTLQYNEILGIK
jgi:alpha-1,3-mannosyltransferase